MATGNNAKKWGTTGECGLAQTDHRLINTHGKKAEKRSTMLYGTHTQMKTIEKQGERVNNKKVQNISTFTIGTSRHALRQGIGIGSWHCLIGSYTVDFIKATETTKTDL